MDERITDKLENGDKVLSGMPYLYRSKGMPSLVYDVRMRKEINHEILNRAIEDALLRYPYFGVKFEERDGDFYAVRNEQPLEARNIDGFIPLGGHSNNYHLMSVTYWDKSLKLSFHHGLTDGRGAKTFLEQIVKFYSDYDGADIDRYEEVKTAHLEIARELKYEEFYDPCEEKHRIDGKSEKIDGLVSKGYTLSETANIGSHRRYEIGFSQQEYMDACRKIEASPLIYLSMLMSRGIKEACPECDKPIVTNFAVDARAILGCESSFKNCVKSMTFPYGEKQELMEDAALAAEYKRLLNAQRDYAHCAKEFNNINMFLGVIGHFHSFASRQKLLGFMDNLKRDTYLISYVGRFDLPEELVEEVHLYSNGSNGIVLNMTCVSGRFVIDVVQDFETDRYITALIEQFEKAEIATKVSEEILFETPYDELSEIITSKADTGEKISNWFEKVKAAAKASTETAKERAKAAENMGRPVKELYYDVTSGSMKEFDPTENVSEELQKIVRATPSIFMK